MFGNVPKALWSRWIMPDNANRIPLACRCMLVRDGDTLILLETGIGAFFEPKLKERYGVIESGHILLDNLKKIGFGHEQIDVVVLSHLHFDHAGGLLTEWQDRQPPDLLFPNADFLVGTAAWERANRPHFRDRASFIPVLNQLLNNSGRLHFVKDGTSELLGDDYKFHTSDGHTPGLLLTEISMPDGPILFAGDLIPGTPWVHLPITMGYDRFPERLIDEKQKLLADLERRNGRLFFTHDHRTACSRIERDDRGRFRSCHEQESLAGITS